MHHKTLFTLAGIFLAVALVVPPTLFYLQTGTVLINVSQLVNSQGTAPPAGTSTSDLAAAINQELLITVIVTVVIEVIFVSLFILMVWLGIKHYHGELDRRRQASLTT